MTAARQWNTIEVSIDGSLAWLRLNRPEHRNTVTSEMFDEVYDAVDELSKNDSLAVVVLTGNGKTFCPGADLLTDRSGDVTSRMLPRPEASHSARLLYEMPQLTVAAINGGCAGAGFAWAAACDLRIASSAARFATAFLPIGLSGELGLAWTLQRQLGSARARELCFLPEKFDAYHALSIGFVSRVFEADQYESQLAGLADELAGRLPDAVRTMKQNFVDASRLPLGDFIEIEGARHRARFSGDEAAATFERLATHGNRMKE